jgi:hypothetical protein
MTDKLTGGCQCGAVRYAIADAGEDAYLCHCRMCQKAMGNLFSAMIGVPKRSVTWTRGRPFAFRSSEHVERGFCAACGTPLYCDGLRLERLAVTIGSLDHPERHKPNVQDGIQSRMPWFAELSSVPDEGETGGGPNVDWVVAVRRSNRQHPDHDTETWPTEERP